MSATKIAASFRVSLTALSPKEADSLVAMAWAWLHFHAAPMDARRTGVQTRRSGRRPSRAESSVAWGPNLVEIIWAEKGTIHGRAAALSQDGVWRAA
jgi:hypothetical protein